MKYYAFILPIFAKAAMFKLLPNTDIIGKIQHTVITEGETLSIVARDYEVGIEELTKANPGIKANKLEPGTEITIPSRFILPEKSLRDGIVVNMAELRLYFFPKGKDVVYTYPVAMGRAGWRTPTTATKVRGKTIDPIWYVPPSIREHSMDKYGNILPEKVMPGPKNPLGKYAIYLEQKGILIHGTNNPSSIGKHVSSGCIRMFNSNVGELYKMVKKGDPVHLIHHANKIGYDSVGVIHLESHPKVEMHQEETSKYSNFDVENELKKHLHNPEKAARTMNEKNGMPNEIE